MESYHCSFREAMSLTIPQTIMLNHAASVARINGERLAKAKHDKEGPDKDPIIGPSGERLSEMQQPENDEKLFAYLRDWSDFG